MGITEPRAERVANGESLTTGDRVRPVFLFSLPRSGSTWLQRILASHSQVGTVAEPWLLLPLIYMYRKHGTLADYSHRTCQRALMDLVKNTPGGIETHRAALREHATSIYSSLSDPNDVYFLDKTPRYYKIIQEILEVFPDAKFIFLFRNPVACYASIVRTWNEGTFKYIWENYADLHEGPRLLSHGYTSVGSRAMSLKYEDLVAYPEREVKRVCAYLELDYESTMLEKTGTHSVTGRMGDQTWRETVDGLHAESLDRWKEVFGDRFRNKLIERYVRQMEPETLKVLGYDKDDLMIEISKLPIRRSPAVIDLFYYLRGWLVRYTKIHLLCGRSGKWSRGVNLN